MVFINKKRTKPEMVIGVFLFYLKVEITRFFDIIYIIQYNISIF